MLGIYDDDEERKKREAEFDSLFGNKGVSSDEYTQRANEFDRLFGKVNNNIQSPNSIDTPINTSNALSEVEKNKALGIDEAFTNEYSQFLEGMDDRAKVYFYQTMTEQPQENPPENVENKELSQEQAHNQAIQDYKTFKDTATKFKKEATEKAKQKEIDNKNTEKLNQQIANEVQKANVTTVSENNTLQKARTKDIVSDTKNIVKFEQKDVKLHTTLQKAKEENLQWYQKIFKKSDAFDDGYQTFDITKTALSTVADFAMSVLKGVASIGEGIGNFLSAGIAEFVDFTGDEENANRIRKNITKEGPTTKFLSDLQDNVDYNSVFAEKSDKTAESVGYTSGLLASSYYGGAAVGNVTIFSSAAGHKATEVYQKDNVANYQAWMEILGSGAIETFTENLFGFFGKTGLDERAGNYVASFLKSGIAKTMARAGISATGEATEELISFTMSQGLDAIVDKVAEKYGGDFDKFYKDPNFEELLESMGIAFASTFIMHGGSTALQVSSIKSNDNVSTKEAINQIAEKQDKQAETEKQRNELDKINKKIANETNMQKRNTMLVKKESMETILSITNPSFVAKYNQDGEVTSLSSTYGFEIENPNKNLNVIPVVVKNDDYYNIIDANNGKEIDTTPYATIEDAESGFVEKVKSLNPSQIDAINNTTDKATLTMLMKRDELQQEYYNDRQSQNIMPENQQNNPVEETTIPNQEINSQINKTSQNGFSEQPDTQNGNPNQINNSEFYHNKTDYQVSNIKEIEKGLGKNKTYTLEEISNKWADIMEDTYDLTSQDDSYVYLGERDGNLEATLYNKDTEEAIDSVIIKQNEDGSYSSNEINKAIKQVSATIDENKPITGQVDIEGNEVRDMKKNKIVNQEKENNNNARVEKTMNKNTQQENDKTNIIDIVVDNKNYGKGVLLKTKIFKGIKPRNWSGILKEHVITNLAGKQIFNSVENNKNKAIYIAKITDRVQKNGAKNSHKVLDKLISTRNNDNIRNLCIEQIEDVIGISKFFGTNKEHSHQWLDENGWELRKALVKDTNNNVYEVTLNIALGRDRNILYDINNIKKIDHGNVSTNGDNSKKSISNNSITQKSQNVKSEKNIINKNVQNNESKTNIQDFGEKIGGARKDLSIPRGTIKTTKEIIHDYTVKITENGFSVDFKGKTLQDGFKTQKEAEEYILAFKDTVKSNLAFVEEMTNVRTGEKVYKIRLRNPRTLKATYTNKSFSNKQDAESYAMALSMYLKENGKNLFRPQIQKVTRENQNNKNATKATGDNILNDFGFKGGEFGNWVTQSERQQFLNYAQDAFTDLAAALDVLPSDLGQNGDMNIAFGARGKGLIAANAHFEPVKKVINMTRLKGAGSLAHEYGHSIDNWLSRIAGYDKDGMVTGNALSRGRLSENLRNAVNEVTDALDYNVSTNEEEVAKKNKIFENSRKEHLENHLSYLDKLFAGKASKYKRVKGKYESVIMEVTEEQEKSYQKIRKTLMDGNLNGDIDYKLSGETLKTEKIYPVEIEKIRTMYKEIVGRKIDDDTLYWLFRYGKPSKQLTEVKSESAYRKSSIELDQMTGRSTPYFSKTEEMWARAFEAYISDKLKAKGITDTYLVHSVNNSDYALFNPFPAGEERQNINKAFDSLIQIMKDEGILHNSKTNEPESNKKENEIRYLKKSISKSTKEFKQDLASKFKDLTGDSIKVAGAKLAGVELRNTWRENGNLDGELEKKPYSKEAMNLYNKYQNSQKTSSYLYHATGRDRLDSIIKNGLTTGNKQNQEGVSSKNEIYLSADPELSEMYANENSVLLRVNPKFYDKFENFRQDYLGGTGSYAITNNIPPEMLQIKEKGKWINLKDFKQNNEDIRNMKKNRKKSNIQGLENYSKIELKGIVNEYIQDKLIENDLNDVSIIGLSIIGSRNRGNAKANSDLDLVVEYSGETREDDLFNILNDEPLEIEGIKVDINPITANKTGTLEEYLERAKKYDNSIINSNDEINNMKINKETKVEPFKINEERSESWIEQEIKKVEKIGGWDNTIPTTSLTDIRKTIEDYLGLGIKKGRFRQDSYAIYKNTRGVIRAKELSDIDSILHETGHALDIGNRLQLDKEKISEELLKATDEIGGYEEESKTIKLEEGFAEVIREYSIIPEQAKTDYPQTVAVLEQIRAADKSFNDFITKVQQQTYNYIHQNPQNRVHSNISVGESNKTPLTKSWLEQEVMRNVWDKDYAVKKAVSEMANINNKTTNQLKASDNAYYLTRLASGIHDKAISMLSDGYITEKGEKLMPGLNKVGEILGDDPQRYNDLRDYLVAKRDTDYKAKTLKTGIRDMDTKYVLEKFENDTQIKEAAQVVYDTLDGVMQYAVDNGLISQDDVAKLKASNAFYVPMQRVIEGRGNQLGRKGAVADIIKARTGSELDIKDVLENIVANSSNIIQQVENNNVLRALYNQGEEAGLTGAIYDVIATPMMKVGTANLSMWESELKKQGVNTDDLDLEKTVDIFAPNNKVDSKNLITSFINKDGKRVYLQFNDEILFNSIMNMDKQFMSQVLKINSKLNMPLRYGATMANVGFAIPNMISDTAQAAIFSNAGFVPIVDNALGVLDILTAKNKHVRNFVKNYSPEYVKRIENMYQVYQQTGATSSTRMSQFRDSTQNNMKDIYGTKNNEVLGINEKYKPLKRLLDILTYIPEISEQSTRFRVFEKNYELYKQKGNSETDARILAALESRDATQDFGRTGNLTREINQLIPFSAARVGSSYTFAEKVKANPKQTAMRLAILTAIGMAIKALGYKDKEIEELNQRKKDDNYVLKMGDNVVTIKKPQGVLRSIVNLTEYIQDLATGHIEKGKEGKRLGEWINNAIMDNMPADSVTGLVPNMVAPLIENAINKDLYYNTDIVKSYDLDLPDSEQYYDYNSQLAILLGKAFNYSPAKIDNLISGYFAGLGTQVTGIMDYVSGKLRITAQKPEMGAESDAVGKRFIVNVNNNSASIDEIYNRKTELTKKKNGGTITGQEETELANLTEAVSNVSKVNKQIKEIKKDLKLSGKDKAEQIRVLQEQKTDIARQALGKELIHSENSSSIETTSFYPSTSTLSLNNRQLELTSDMKKEYAQIASEYYKRYESQGLYSEDKLKQLKSKAKEYAKSNLMQKYKSQLVRSK